MGNLVAERLDSAAEPGQITFTIGVADAEDAVAAQVQAEWAPMHGRIDMQNLHASLDGHGALKTSTIRRLRRVLTEWKSRVA